MSPDVFARKLSPCLQESSEAAIRARMVLFPVQGVSEGRTVPRAEADEVAALAEFKVTQCNISSFSQPLQLGMIPPDLSKIIPIDSA